MHTSRDLTISKTLESPLDLDTPGDQSKSQQILQLQQMVLALQAQVASDTQTGAMVAHQQTQLQDTALKAYKAVEDNNRELQEIVKAMSKEKAALVAEVSQLKAQLTSQASAASKVKIAAESLATKQTAEINQLRAEVKRLRSNEALYDAHLREEETTWNKAIANTETAPLSPYSKRRNQECYTRRLEKIETVRSNLVRK